MAATATKFGTPPSRLLQFPPDEAWLGYCLDEALAALLQGHENRDYRWRERFRNSEGRDGSGGGRNLYDENMADPRLGKPPSRDDLRALEYAASHSAGAAQ